MTYLAEKMFALKCKCGHAKGAHVMGEGTCSTKACECESFSFYELKPEDFEATVVYSFTGLTEAQQEYLRAQLLDPWPGKNILLPKGVTMMQAAQFMHTLYRDDHFKTVLQ